MKSYINEIELNGFSVVQCVLAQETVASLVHEISEIRADEGSSQRAGRAFGIRNLFNALPSARSIANSASMRSLVEPVLGSSAKVVRGVYFDKHKEANWKVAWHQDLSIAVRERVLLDGYGPWSIKAGIHHVQPPISVLESMLTVRLHLDHTDESNGPLRVLQGSHKYGRLEAQEIQDWRRTQGETVCPVTRGGVVSMRPLLLHASSAAANPNHRRVLHLEYSSTNLPSGLDWFDAEC